MQLDDAAGGDGSGGGYCYRGRRAASWETAFEHLQRRFDEVGRKVTGTPWAAPRIIFWNLRGNTVGFPVAKDTPNVQMLSGFSPALLKLVISGADIVADEQEQVQPDGTVKFVRAGPTPEQTLRSALDDADFDVVRVKLTELEAGPFKEYAFARTTGGFEVVQGAEEAVAAEAEAADDFEVVDAD